VGSKSNEKTYHSENPLVWSRNIYSYNKSENGEEMLAKLCSGMWNMKTRPVWDKQINTETHIATDKKSVIIH
jgi:hypothetical protein